MAAEAEPAAGLGGEGEGQVVEGPHPRVKSDGLSVMAEACVGAEEGVSQRDRYWLRHLREQLASTGRAVACTVQHEEGIKAAVMEIA